MRLHLKHVEGLRAVAALVVFVNHAYAQVWEGPRALAAPTGLLGPLSYSLVAGHLAVTVFIVVSGFCLALPVVRSGDRLRDGSAAFIKHRAWRILPPYYAALVLSLILIATLIGEPTGTLWDVPIQVTPVAVVSHLLLLQDLFATGSINYVFWSIAVEWQIYFLFPLMLWGWRRFGPWTTLGVALVIGYAFRMGFADTRIARTNSHFIGMFVMGMLAAYVSQSTQARYLSMRSRRAWPILALAAFVVACGVVASVDITKNRYGFPIVDFFIGVMTLSLLVLTSRDSANFVTRVLASRPLVFIGAFSYSVYLIHAPLLQLLWQYALKPLELGGEVMFALLMTVGLLAILAAAHLFYRLFEAPFMRAAREARRARLPDPIPVR